MENNPENGENSNPSEDEELEEETSVQEENVYPSSAENPRGLAMILNVENFDNGAVRRGSSRDVDRLTELWTSQRYRVVPSIDPTLQVNFYNFTHQRHIDAD